MVMVRFFGSSSYFYFFSAVDVAEMLVDVTTTMAVDVVVNLP